MAAQIMLQFGLQHNGRDIDKMAMYFRDGNKLAKSAKNTLTTLAPKLKANLTADNIAHLNKVLDYIIEKLICYMLKMPMY